MTGGALVLGADYRGLGVMQSLGRHGIAVALVHEHGRGVANFSRYCTKAFCWPDADEDRRVAYLLELVRRERLAGWTLVPSGDETAAMCARHADVLGQQLRLTTPPWSVLERAYDKRLTSQLAAEADVPYPKTWEPARDGITGLGCEYPVIIKPAVKRLANDLTVAKAWRVDDKESLVARYEEAARLMPPEELLVQELLPGTGEHQYSFAALAADGEPIATIVARRTRQYPMDFGRASTFVESIRAPEVEELGRRIITTLACTGLVEVEFKRDVRSGELKLLDVNARVWGWHALGRRAGVDFPWLLWRLVNGDRPAPVAARPGVRWMWPSADIPIVAREIWRHRLRLRDYAAGFRRPLDLATLTRDDPLPGLVELPLRLVHACVP